MPCVSPILSAPSLTSSYKSYCCFSQHFSLPLSIHQNSPPPLSSFTYHPQLPMTGSVHNITFLAHTAIAPPPRRRDTAVEEEWQRGGVSCMCEEHHDVQPAVALQFSIPLNVHKIAGAVKDTDALSSPHPRPSNLQQTRFTIQPPLSNGSQNGMLTKPRFLSHACPSFALTVMHFSHTDTKQAVPRCAVLHLHPRSAVFYSRTNSQQ
ncbi:hypothetical protein BC826DRAFT_658646 [Russula brevipes]|nr:hypothetical protein BC826DRAFT_658646 [Russula brevipes]